MAHDIPLLNFKMNMYSRSAASTQVDTACSKAQIVSSLTCLIGRLFHFARCVETSLVISNNLPAFDDSSTAKTPSSPKYYTFVTRTS